MVDINSTEKYSRGMEALRIIREKIRIPDRSGEYKVCTEYAMAKKLGISQTQYQYLENEAKTLQTHLLIKLQEIAEKEAGYSLKDFWALIKKTNKK